jgi:hypothetical protein
VVSGAIGGILLIISVIDAWVRCRPGFHQVLYVGVLYVGGIIVTGKIFKELHHNERGPAWLLLPASQLEKFLSRLLLSTVLYAVGTMILYFFFSVISEGVNGLLFGRHHNLFQPFDPMILKSVAYYVVLQSPFLAGAVYFRKHNLSKTILTLMAYSFVLLVVVMISTWLLFGSYIDGMFSTFEFLDRLPHVITADFTSNMGTIKRVGLWTGRIIFWVIMAPLFWTVGYYRLRETEK